MSAASIYRSLPERDPRVKGRGDIVIHHRPEAADAATSRSALPSLSVFQAPHLSWDPFVPPVMRRAFEYIARIAIP
jgi:hypothetical protein